MNGARPQERPPSGLEPHPGRVPQPSSAAMPDLLLAWTGDGAAIRRILVDNPAMLYGYTRRSSHAADLAELQEDS